MTCQLLHRPISTYILCHWGKAGVNLFDKEPIWKTHNTNLENPTNLQTTLYTMQKATKGLCRQNISNFVYSVNFLFQNFACSKINNTHLVLALFHQLSLNRGKAPKTSCLYDIYLPKLDHLEMLSPY